MPIRLLYSERLFRFVLTIFLFFFFKSRCCYYNLDAAVVSVVRDPLRIQCALPSAVIPSFVGPSRTAGLWPLSGYHTSNHDHGRGRGRTSKTCISRCPSGCKTIFFFIWTIINRNYFGSRYHVKLFHFKMYSIFSLGKHATPTGRRVVSLLPR